MVVVHRGKDAVILLHFLVGSTCDSTKCAYRSAASTTLPIAQADVGSDAHRRQPHPVATARSDSSRMPAVASQRPTARSRTLATAETATTTSKGE
ncbi:hypothetical protein B296_00051845 [Ensete ventricosum]|uniref:Uncharacterized protein n=1 Tax=Ensete ventricosum TaxID=4639 RepID=A0A426X7T9_ENSVE|nr:hypothetical protein B296_00051845 [Ensete ventricosum]